MGWKTVKVKEMRNLLSGLKNEGKLTNQTIEFVADAKKFFAHDVKAGANTMTFEITRDNYHPLTLNRFEESLNLAGGDLDIQVKQGNNTKAITDTFLTDQSFELVVG